MVNNLFLKTGKSTQPRVVTLIAGGFHAPGIEALLKQKGYSFVTVSPKIENASGGNDYLQAFSGYHAPIEKLLLGEKLFLTKPAVLAMERIVDDMAVAAQVPPVMMSVVDPALLALTNNSPAALAAIQSHWASQFGLDIQVTNIQINQGHVEVLAVLKQNNKTTQFQLRLSPQLGKENSASLLPGYASIGMLEFNGTQYALSVTPMRTSRWAFVGDVLGWIQHIWTEIRYRTWGLSASKMNDIRSAAVDALSTAVQINENSQISNSETQAFARVDVELIQQWLSEQNNETLYVLFSKAELKDAGTGELQAKKLAGRYAAKMAAASLLGKTPESLPLNEISVVREESGQPTLVFSKNARKQLGLSQPQLPLSLSYNQRLQAYAVVALPASLDVSLRLGTDAVDLDKFEEITTRNSAFVQSVFTAGELSRAPKDKQARSAYLARVFAVKEAFLKALGLGIGGKNISLKEVDVDVDSTGEFRASIPTYKRDLFGLSQAKFIVQSVLNDVLGVVQAWVSIQGGNLNFALATKTGVFRDQALNRETLIGNLARGLEEKRFLIHAGDAAAQELASIRESMAAVNQNLKAIESAGMVVRFVEVTPKAYDDMDNVPRGYSNELMDKSTEAELKFTIITLNKGT
jgi:phosphopantetheine--protein transferase-like protein